MKTSECIQDVSFSDCASSHVGKLCLQLNCNSDCIHVLRSMVAVMSARAGMDELQSNRVAIAVDELFANIATHAYNGKPGRIEFVTSIEICEHGDQELVFDFRDYASIGWGGNISEIVSHALDTEQLCPGGLGLRLICSVADRCEHDVLEDGNRWRLIFHTHKNDKFAVEEQSKGGKQHECTA